ncbi:hypothetical protein HOLDEFILI_03680 [Holdemania filiformis DSM 12042]|uniref:Uncharacterized protein n=1 Tax=Holdemania filiformis DSM 12042 TaxID=545696 RepID=B9YCW8_9FIRM|nr:hypothetical protein HOLDEFILI_03680 [Holdemania filiformis DSM 12042]
MIISDSAEQRNEKTVDFHALLSIPRPRFSADCPCFFCSGKAGVQVKETKIPSLEKGIKKIPRTGS